MQWFVSNELMQIIYKQIINECFKNVIYIFQDIIFTSVAGIFVTAAGSIFIYCAIIMDNYLDGELRKETKYIHKLAAGVNQLH